MDSLPRNAEKRLEETIPDLLALLQRAVERQENGQKAVPVRVSLDAFAQDPITLYEWLWFAASKCVPVLFLPRETGKARVRRRKRQEAEGRSETGA